MKQINVFKELREIDLAGAEQVRESDSGVWLER